MKIPNWIIHSVTDLSFLTLVGSASLFVVGLTVIPEKEKTWKLCVGVLATSGVVAAKFIDERRWRSGENPEIATALRFEANAEKAVIRWLREQGCDHPKEVLSRWYDELLKNDVTGTEIKSPSLIYLWMIQAIALERFTATDTSLSNTESKSEDWHWAFYPWREDNDDLVPEITAVPSSACTGCKYFSHHEYLPCAVHPMGRPQEGCKDFVKYRN